MQPATDTSRAQHWRPVLGSGFYLERSRHAQVLLAFAAIAAGDALYQQFASPLRLISAGWQLWAMLIVSAGAAYALGRWWLSRGVVPPREAAGIAGAFALALSMSNFHTAHWLEVATDADGAEEILYRRGAESGVVFLPVDGDGPRLTFRRDKDYWDSLSSTKPYGFVLARGWSGSWVLDEAPLREDIALHRNFFRGLEPQP